MSCTDGHDSLSEIPSQKFGEVFSSAFSKSEPRWLPDIFHASTEMNGFDLLHMNLGFPVLELWSAVSSLVFLNP
jgi:hypothetical protein